MVGILLFATFRFAGSKWFTRFRQRHGINLDASLPPSTAAATAPTTTTISSTAAASTPRQVHAQFQSYSEKQAEKASAALSDASGLTLDIFVSFMAGLSSMFWLLDREKLAQDFARTPLVPGKSILYNEVCGDMEAAYDKIDSDVWDSTANNSEDERTLQAMKMFVQNCRQRSEYLRSRREGGHHDGADDDRSDIVPHPGLEGAVE